MQLSHLIIIGNHTKLQTYVVERVLGNDMLPINTRYVVLLNLGYTLQNARWRQIFEAGFKTLEEALLELQRFDRNYKMYADKGLDGYEMLPKKF